MTALRPWLGLTCLLTFACGDGEPDQPREPIVLQSGPNTVRVDPEHRRFTLQRDTEDLLVFDAAAITLGTVAALDDSANYDPYPLATEDPAVNPPEGLTWRSAQKMEARRDGAAVIVTLDHGAGTRSSMRIEAAADGRFVVNWSPQSGEVAYLSLRPRVDASEAFYGLGEVFDDVNHRGKIRAMQLEVSGELESTNNEAHVPIPFLIGTRGWGLFVENPYPGVFDVASTDPDRAHATFGTGLASEQGLRFHLFSEQKPLDLTRHYYAVTGAPLLPARWALGPWVWRDEHDDQAQVEADADAIRDLDLATSAYWIDRPYATGVNTFDFEAARFPDPPAMIAKLHALGMRVALWHTPYLDKEDPATASLHQEAKDKGFFPPVVGPQLNKWSAPLDFTNPDAVSWWQSHLSKYVDLGIEGFKLDYAEDIVPGLLGVRTVWNFHDGSDERTMHSQYQRLYHRTYAEVLPESGSFLLCRAGTYGDQVNVSVIWPGDLDANFAEHGERIDEGGEKYTAVGGLPASVVAGLSLGPSGFPFYGSDTGGYRHSPPDKETFTRWFQQTALSSVMQIGTSTNDVAWEPTPENGFDQEMLDWYRIYTRLHLRLFPYEWTYAQKIAETGHPIQRPLGLAHPELGVHPSDTYLFGEHLLVAPVLERGVTQRTAMLPEGDWVDWWTGEVHSGPGEVTLTAPLDKLPLLARAGALIPMLRPTIDSLSPTTDPARVDSFATSAGALWVRLAPGPASEFLLYDGAELSSQLFGNELVLESSDGSEFAAGVMFEVMALGAAPSSATLDGTPLPTATSLAELETLSSGMFFDGTMLFVKVPAGTHSVRLTLPS